MRIELYNALVNRVPGIKSRYQTLRKKVSGAGRIRCWAALLWWNASYYIFCRKAAFEQTYQTAMEKKQWEVSRSESACSRRESPGELAERLSSYDVISFDVFDTLIFRPFSAPTDLFFQVGHRLGYPDFVRIRKEMEWKAREKKFQTMQTREVTLYDIWDLMEAETGLPKELGMQTEWECEKQYCFANPYMKEVVHRLRKQDKKIIITSDMYLREVMIRELLESCGYEPFDGYLVSCEYGVSKGDGGLYQQVKEQFGASLSYVHVGDNAYSDQKKAKEAGFGSVSYKNVNDAGDAYRSEDMSVITGGMYRGLVNTKLHAGIETYSKAYELGFVYGGLFVTGYCQFIHQQAKLRQVDQILFLSRDGDILKKVYDRLYPKEQTSYVYWSRKAATKLTADHFRYDYFRRFLYHKMNQGYILEQIFSSMELSDLLPGFVRETKITPDTVLNEREADACKSYLLAHWSDVLALYDKESRAGKAYYEKILTGCSRALAVDIGWAGSGAIALQYLCTQVWHLDCEITGVVAGTNTCHNAEPDTSETFLQSGQLISYLYSQRENRDLWKFHDLNQDHNLYLELLLCSPTPTFAGFGFDREGNVDLKFGKMDENTSGMKEIQEGILDFAAAWNKHFGADHGFAQISGRDAYAPLIVMLNHKKYLEEVDQMFHLHANVE